MSYRVTVVRVRLAVPEVLLVVNLMLAKGPEPVPPPVLEYPPKVTTPAVLSITDVDKEPPGKKEPMVISAAEVMDNRPGL